MMNDKEINYLNARTAGRREKLRRRDELVHRAIQWGGWLIAAMVLTVALVTRVC